jgi:hypothetical protein
MLAGVFFLSAPAGAFTANSLDITVDRNGDAIATFRFTLEGILENSIPQSILEEELKKGLTTSAEPPELKSMDKTSAVLLLRKFADVADVPTGTEYRTASMDFKKAEIALQNSALSSAVSADFSPEKIVLTFPDLYRREFTDTDVLPAVSHTVIDPSKTPRPQASPGDQPVVSSQGRGSLNVTSSPENVKVYLDSGYIGEAPAVFPEIPAGTHRVEFRKDGFESASKTVTILEDKTTNVLVVLKYVPPVVPEESPATPWYVWAFLLVAVIAIAGGGYYFWSERKKFAGEEEEEEPDEKAN